jgi:transposase
MKIKLTEKEEKKLEKMHRTERDGKTRDRIKAVLLANEGWIQEDISQALRISVGAVRAHLQDYTQKEKLTLNSGGGDSFLTEAQAKELVGHLEVVTYPTVKHIIVLVESLYGVRYSESGMTQWLKRNGFSYKKPKGIPFKADAKKQEMFIEEYIQLKDTTPEDEPILFLDGVHPTMSTKLGYGWMKKGQDKFLPTTASRTRINIVGSLELKSMTLVFTQHEMVNSKSIIEHLTKIREAYPNALRIRLIIDQASYNKSKETRDAAAKLGIILYYLPPYSPNLNPIERLWKVMNEETRNNVFFESAKEFRNAIYNFFSVRWHEISEQMRGRINDNFEIIHS